MKFFVVKKLFSSVYFFGNELGRIIPRQPRLAKPRGRVFPKKLFLVLLLFLWNCPRVQKSNLEADSPLIIILGIWNALRNPPVFSPEPGTFSTPQTVTITHRNKVPVRYTLDGTTTPSCTVGEIYDDSKKIELGLGKFVLQAAECFEGFSSTLGKGNYSVTGSFRYNEELNDAIPLFSQINHSLTALGLDPSLTYRFSVTPSLEPCLSLNTTTGNITETCTSDISDVEYTITATSNSSSKPDLVNKVRIGGTWGFEQEAYLKAPNAFSGDTFGTAVSISGDTIVVGTKEERSTRTTIINGSIVTIDNVTASIGAAYVFRRTGNTWVHESYLKASNSNVGVPRFGNAVAISGDTIAVAAPTEASNQTTITNGTSSSLNISAGDSGAVFVYRRTGVNWAQEAYIKASNAEVSDSFGDSVAIFGDTIAVGATREDSAQITITNGTTSAADNTPDINAEIGAVYVYRRNGTNWTQEAYIKSANGDSADWFGYRVRLSDNTLVVTSSREASNQTTITNGTTASADNSFGSSGAVFVYRRTGNVWTQEAFLKAPNAETGDFFGEGIGIFEDTIVVGAQREDSNQTTITNGTTAALDNTPNTSTNRGAVYVFRRTGTTWVGEAYIKAVNNDPGDFFGSQIDIHGDTIVVGVPRESSNQTTITNGTTASGDNSSTNNGAAYVYRRSGSSWYQIAYVKGVNLGTGAPNGFGTGVGIFEDRIVVGAPSEDSSQTTISNGTTAPPNSGNPNSGAAYVYRLRRF